MRCFVNLVVALVALQQGDRQYCRACVLPIEGSTVEQMGSAVAPPPPDETDGHYDESELMTIKEAADYFGRTKLYELRKQGKLITVEHGPREKRLVRAQVVALARWRRR